VKALISGQAGVAILLEGSAVYSIDIDSTDDLVRREHADIRLLVGEAQDAYWLRGKTQDEVVAELGVAWRRDRSLQLFLMALDPEEDDEFRAEAAECLDDLLSGERDREQLASVMYSSPLPNPEAAEEALAFGRPGGPVAKFLRRLIDAQPAIKRWCAAWDAVPVVFCGGPEEKRLLRLRAVRAGAFRVFVEEQGRGDAGLLRLFITDEFKGNTHGRKVLQAWAASFRKRITNAEFSAEPPEDLIESGGLRKVRRRKKLEQPIHRVFTGVNVQKDEIKRLLQEGKRDTALRYTRELIDWQRTNSESEHISKSLCDLAQHCKMLGDYSLHLELSRWAVKEKPDDSWAYAQMGDAYRLIGDYEASVEAYELSGRYGDERVAMCGRAEILKDHGQVEEALEVFEACVARFPDEPVARCGRAAALASVGRFVEAEKAYREVIDEFPDNVVAETGLAHVLGEMGRYDEAMKLFDVLIHTRPHEDVPHCARAELLRDTGRLEEALQAFQAVIKRMPLSTYAHNGRARVLKDMGRLDDALVAYTEVISKFERHPFAHFGRADTLKKLGRLDDSAGAYRALLARMPRNSMAKNGLASVLAAQGLFEEALNQLPDVAPAAYGEWMGYHLRGVIYLAQGRVQETVSHLETGLKTLPWLTLRHSFHTSLATAKVRQRAFESAAALVTGIPKGSLWAAAKLIEVHAYGMLDQGDRVNAAYQQLKAGCPPQLRNFREALARRFVTKVDSFRWQDENWLYKQECFSLFLAA
jgi:tetratricopeptide (TPR) repeat protein